MVLLQDGKLRAIIKVAVHEKINGGVKYIYNEIEFLSIRQTLC